MEIGLDITFGSSAIFIFQLIVPSYLTEMRESNPKYILPNLSNAG